MNLVTREIREIKKRVRAATGLAVVGSEVKRAQLDSARELKANGDMLLTMPVNAEIPPGTPAWHAFRFNPETGSISHISRDGYCSSGHVALFRAGQVADGAVRLLVENYNKYTAARRDRIAALQRNSRHSAGCAT